MIMVFPDHTYLLFWVKTNQDKVEALMCRRSKQLHGYIAKGCVDAQYKAKGCVDAQSNCLGT